MQLITSGRNHEEAIYRIKRVSKNASLLTKMRFLTFAVCDCDRMMQLMTAGRNHKEGIYRTKRFSKKQTALVND